MTKIYAARVMLSGDGRNEQHTGTLPGYVERSETTRWLIPRRFA
jgi:hypothetical protein